MPSKFNFSLALFLPLNLLCFLVLSNADSAVPRFGPVPDSEVQADWQAMEKALLSPWAEQFPSGVQRLETKRESFALSEAQKALFNQRWELETIQREKPQVPRQFELEMLADALEVVVEMDEEKRAVLLRMDKLETWAKEEEEEKEGKAVGEGEEEELEEAGGEEQARMAQLANLVGEEDEEWLEEPQCSEDQRPVGGMAIPVDMDPANRTELPLAMSMEQQQQLPFPMAGDGQPMMIVMLPSSDGQGEEEEDEDEAANAADGGEGKGGEGQGQRVMYVVEEGEAPEAEDEGKKQEEGEGAKADEEKEKEQQQREEEKPEEKPEDDVAKPDEQLEAEDEGKKGKKEEKDSKEKGEDDSEEKKPASGEGSGEKTVFKAIQGQKNAVEGEGEKEPEAMIIVDLAKGTDSDEEDEGKDAKEEAAKAAMNLAQMAKHASSSSSEDEEEKKGTPLVAVEVVETNEGEEGKKASGEDEADKPVDEAEGNRPKEEGQEGQGNSYGFLGVLGRLLFGRKKREVAGTRAKRDVIFLTRSMPVPLAEQPMPMEEQPILVPIPMAPSHSSIPVPGPFANQTVPANEEGQEKKKPLLVVRSIMGRMAMGNARVGIEAKWEMTMGIPQKENGEEEAKSGEEKGTGTGHDSAEAAPKSGENGGQEVPPVQAVHVLGEETNKKSETAGNGQGNGPMGWGKRADLVQYMNEYVARTGGPKRPEKLAYVWYSELQYWLAKQIEAHSEEGEEGKGVVQILDGLKEGEGGEEMAFLRANWAKTMARLAILTDWIGKEFRRRK